MAFRSIIFQIAQYISNFTDRSGKKNKCRSVFSYGFFLIFFGIDIESAICFPMEFRKLCRASTFTLLRRSAHIFSAQNVNNFLTSTLDFDNYIVFDIEFPLIFLDYFVQNFSNLDKINVVS